VGNRWRQHAAQTVAEAASAVALELCCELLNSSRLHHPLDGVACCTSSGRLTCSCPPPCCCSAPGKQTLDSFAIVKYPLTTESAMKKIEDHNTLVRTRGDGTAGTRGSLNLLIYVFIRVWLEERGRGAGS
jgi:hypothetical protein